MREGQWKLVYRRSDSEEQCGHSDGNNGGDPLKCWELYNMEDDRTETHNLAMDNRVLVNQMAERWMEWALRVGIKPWPLKPLSEGERDWSNLPWLW
jgi:arylsulfatase